VGLLALVTYSFGYGCRPLVQAGQPVELASKWAAEGCVAQLLSGPQ